MEATKIVYTNEQVNTFNEMVHVSFEYDTYHSGKIDKNGELIESLEFSDRNYNSFSLEIYLKELKYYYSIGYGESGKNPDEFASELMAKFVELDFNQSGIRDYLESL